MPNVPSVISCGVATTLLNLASPKRSSFEPPFLKFSLISMELSLLRSARSSSAPSPSKSAYCFDVKRLSPKNLSQLKIKVTARTTAPTIAVTGLDITIALATVKPKLTNAATAGFLIRKFAAMAPMFKMPLVKALAAAAAEVAEPIAWAVRPTVSMTLPTAPTS